MSRMFYFTATLLGVLVLIQSISSSTVDKNEKVDSEASLKDSGSIKYKLSQVVNPDTYKTHNQNSQQQDDRKHSDKSDAQKQGTRDSRHQNSNFQQRSNDPLNNNEGGKFQERRKQYSEYENNLSQEQQNAYKDVLAFNKQTTNENKKQANRESSASSMDTFSEKRNIKIREQNNFETRSNDEKSDDEKENDPIEDECLDYDLYEKNTNRESGEKTESTNAKGNLNSDTDVSEDLAPPSKKGGDHGENYSYEYNNEEYGIKDLEDQYFEEKDEYYEKLFIENESGDLKDGNEVYEPEYYYKKFAQSMNSNEDNGEDEEKEIPPPREYDTILQYIYENSNDSIFLIFKKWLDSTSE